ncbi:MAG: hypothetical protein H7Y03_13630 [Chitinophagaceae bacterium]|nr:hypothetical protein [Chitinophagaceae bacterium]
MKKFLVIFLILGILVAGGLFYLKQRKLRDFEPEIKQRLARLVHDASKGLYKLEMERLEIDLLKSKLTLVKAHLVPDSAMYASLEKQEKAPNDLFDIYLDKLVIGDIDIASLATNKNISLNRLFIDSPDVKVWHKKQSYNIKDDSSKTLYEQISKDIDKIKIDTILLRNVVFTYYNRKKNDKKTRFENVNIVFTGMLVDSTTQFDQNRFLFAEDCRISLKDYSIKTGNNLYLFSAGDLQIRTRDKAMDIKDISLKPQFNNNEFYKRVKRQEDIFNISIASLRFDKVEWWSLLGEESFLSSKMKIADGRIKVYNDKTKRPGTEIKLGKFPHQLLSKVPFNIEIDTIGVSNMDVSYEELNPKSLESGTIHFNNITGNITNVTNNADLIKKDKNCIISVDALFLEETPLRAVFNFNLAAVKKGDFTLKATVGRIGHERLNKILIPLAMVKINSVNVKGVDLSIRGDNYNGSGTVKLLYDNLNITALKNDGDTLKKRGLLSFFANNFVIYKSNPEKGDAPRVEKAVHKHNPQKSFFNLVWKTIFAGAANTVGFQPKQ